jgi:hypothetical protein
MVFDSAGRIQSSGRRNKRLKILIIAQYFPPQNAIASLRLIPGQNIGPGINMMFPFLLYRSHLNQRTLLCQLYGFRVIEVPIPGAAYLQSVRGRKTHFNSNFSTVSYNGMSQEHAQRTQSLTCCWKNYKSAMEFSRPVVCLTSLIYGAKWLSMQSKISIGT